MGERRGKPFLCTSNGTAYAPEEKRHDSTQEQRLSPQRRKQVKEGAEKACRNYKLNERVFSVGRKVEVKVNYTKKKLAALRNEKKKKKKTRNSGVTDSPKKKKKEPASTIKQAGVEGKKMKRDPFNISVNKKNAVRGGVYVKLRGKACPKGNRGKGSGKLIRIWKRKNARTERYHGR